MAFITWLVIGALFMLLEFGIGTFYVFALGLAFIYPAFVAYSDASANIQLMALGGGTFVHLLLVRILRRYIFPPKASTIPTDVGERVEVIEWVEECTARVMHRGREWPADKANGDMPDASHGIIQSVQYGRLIISTEDTPQETPESSIG
jgi:membrane protein implicated in regulation of membrane protease activity